MFYIILLPKLENLFKTKFYRRGFDNQSIFSNGDLDLGATNLTFDRCLPFIDTNVHAKYHEDWTAGTALVGKLSHGMMIGDRWTDKTDGQGKNDMPPTPTTIVAVA